ncbi:MAG: 16S rRNA (cytosine(1402)-N(4))-methyltransferase [Chloroflexi bacterium]|nr:MAG: 16S rRNA (cytosine(1402)-N(4))-methyltransferase [Chloroflexota bacterium]PIE80301.1 MAG: 16S rRNA (cytosine(1402)-N(4))-methyltransferase [Chloroflexota bacterium]
MTTHIPVLYHEVLHLLQPQAGEDFIDGTVGAGGHLTGILEATAPDGRALGFDKDPQAITYAAAKLDKFGKRVTVVNKSYAEMPNLAPQLGFAQVNGILLDLGLSSRQLDDGSRGFSFRFEAPLDMRYNQTKGETAADLVNNLSEAELADIFWRYGEEKQSRKIARLIVENRPITTTTQLAHLIEAHAGKRNRRLHPATLVFQALRIAVNHELNAVETGIPAAIKLLKPGGRIAVISFHSLEDRFVKRLFRQLSQDCICPPQQPICTCNNKAIVKRITRKAVKATAAEIKSNPRSRSARLRVIEKLP